MYILYGAAFFLVTDLAIFSNCHPILLFSRKDSVTKNTLDEESKIFRGWGRGIRTPECWDQNPVPYRLASPQYVCILR